MRLYIEEFRMQILGDEDKLSGIIRKKKKLEKLRVKPLDENLDEKKARQSQPFLRLPDSPTERKQQALANNAKFDKQYGKTFKPQGPHSIFRDPGSINAFLKQDQLAFFGGHVSLNIEAKARVLESELVKDYQMRLQAADEEKKNVLEEHRVMKKFFNEICQLSDSRQEEILDLR